MCEKRSNRISAVTRHAAFASFIALPAFTTPALLAPTIALAACAPAVPVNGAVLVCEGTTQSAGINVLGTGVETDVTLTVGAGATILGNGGGPGTRGVYLGDDAQITNFGTIDSNYQAVQIVGDLINLDNYGVITGFDRAVQTATGNLSNLTNYGIIQAAGLAINTFPGGDISNVVNYGSILGGDGAIFADNVDNLFNSGLLRGSIVAVRAADGFSNIVNSGTIEGGDQAIHEIGTVDTNLTLNSGSILIGRADLGGGTNTLNLGSGLSLNSTFESDGGVTFISLGTLSGHLAASAPVTGGGTNNDAEAVAVDISALAGFDDALAALTSGIGGAAQLRLSSMRSDPGLGFAAGDVAGSEQLNPNRFWIEGFGAYHQGQGDRVGSDFDHLIGGLVAGVDVPLDAVSSVGVMAGSAASTSQNEINTQTTDATSFYAGVYASTQVTGLVLDASLTVGHTAYEAARVTANNLVAGGLETARANFGGWFINPQVTATREASTPLAGQSFHGFTATPILEQSLSLSYAGLFLDGYTETGTTNPLTLDDRSVHVASAHAALALPFERIEADGALTTLRLIGGLEARTQFGDGAVSGTLLGQAVTTTLDDDDFAAGGFLGLSSEYQTISGLTAYTNAEALLEADMSYQLSANAGLRIAF